MVTGSRRDKLGSGRASSFVGVETNNDVVLLFNQVLTLDPTRMLTIHSDTSVHLIGSFNTKRPEVSITVALASQLGVRQEVENAKETLSERSLVARLTSEVIEILITTLNVV